MTKAKESFFEKKSKRDSEQRAKDQAHISKILAKFQATYGEPIQEIFEAQEEGIAIGKRHIEADFSDKLDKKVIELKDEICEMAHAEMEKDIEEEVARRVDKKSNPKSLQAMVNDLQKIFEAKKLPVMIFAVLEKNEDSNTNIISVFGSVNDHARLLASASQQDDRIERCIVKALAAIAMQKETGCSCGHCHK